MIIAIDGHVGSGKSTVASKLAEELNYRVFNTGSMYRAIACEFLHMGYKEEDISEEFIEDFANQLKTIEIFFDDTGLQHVVVNGNDHTKSLRKEEISYMSSHIAPFTVIREKVRKIQRDFANSNNCIMEGRDIATVVLPNADVKLFITASKEVRAKRRYNQLIEQGKDADFNEILTALEERDELDETREIAKLKPAEDSVILDTSNMTLDQTIEKILNLLKKR